MASATRAWSAQSRARYVAVVAAVAAAATTALVVVVPDLHLAYRNADLHVALVTAEGLIALLCAYLLLGRLRERGCLDDLLLCLALSTLALANLFFSALPAVLGADTSVFSTWAALGGRTIGAVLVAASALIASRPISLDRRRVVSLSAALPGTLLALALMVWLARDGLPAGVDVDASPERSNRPLLAGHPVILAAQILRAALYGVAAVGFTRRAERTGDRLVAWLAVGCVFSAVAGVNYFLYPSLFTEFVYTGDAFRLAFYVVVVLAAESEIRSYWRRAASAAASEERQRLARDLHDGLTQELAGIRRNLLYLDADDRAVARAQAAADRALGSARTALETLDDGSRRPFRDALELAARAIGSQEGVTVTVELAPGIDVRDREAHHALVMIASEAVRNAARHSEAAVVRLQAVNGDGLVLRVRDDGRGFDTVAAEALPGHYGLRTMQARAIAIGATLRVDSEAGRGTVVEVTYGRS